MFRNARSEIYDALDNADSSRMLIAIMTALSEGKDLIIKQLLSSVTDGIDSTSDEAIDKATLDLFRQCWETRRSCHHLLRVRSQN